MVELIIDSIRVGLRHSTFKNDVSTMFWDNPFRLVGATDPNAYQSPGSGSIGGSNLGFADLWPDNESNLIFADGRAELGGNWFVQGAGKENWGTLIAVAPEGRENSSAGLVIEGNDVALAPGFGWTTAFVGDWSGEPLVIRDNRLDPRIRLHARR